MKQIASALLALVDVAEAQQRPASLLSARRSGTGTKREIRR